MGELAKTLLNYKKKSDKNDSRNLLSVFDNFSNSVISRNCSNLVNSVVSLNFRNFGNLVTFLF